jgi:hypothetical protein
MTRIKKSKALKIIKILNNIRRVINCRKITRKSELPEMRRKRVYFQKLKRNNSFLIKKLNQLKTWSIYVLKRRYHMDKFSFFLLVIFSYYYLYLKKHKYLIWLQPTMHVYFPSGLTAYLNNIGYLLGFAFLLSIWYFPYSYHHYRKLVSRYFVGWLNPWKYRILLSGLVKNENTGIEKKRKKKKVFRY